MYAMCEEMIYRLEALAKKCESTEETKSTLLLFLGSLRWLFADQWPTLLDLTNKR